MRHLSETSGAVRDGWRIALKCSNAPGFQLTGWSAALLLVVRLVASRFLGSNGIGMTDPRCIGHVWICDAAWSSSVGVVGTGGKEDSSSVITNGRAGGGD